MQTTPTVSEDEKNSVGRFSLEEGGKGSFDIGNGIYREMSMHLVDVPKGQLRRSTPIADVHPLNGVYWLRGFLRAGWPFRIMVKYAFR